MNRTIARIVSLWGLSVGVLFLDTIPGHASHQPFAVYEDWVGTSTIRSDRWLGSSDLGQERRREVEGNKLLMRFRREGYSLPGFFSNRLNFARPVTIDQVEGDFRVRSLTVTGCQGNPTASITRAAAIDIHQFSDVDGTGFVRQHIARIQARRASDSLDPAGTLSIFAVVFRCDNPACTLSTEVTPRVILGQVKVGHKFALRLIWDKLNRQFRAGLNDAPDMAMSYLAVSNPQPAVAPFVLIRIQHSPAQCPEASGNAEIEVREVRTNASAVIP